MQMVREFFIPTGATKVADKKSDAVAYVIGKSVWMFWGKQAKPVAVFTASLMPVDQAVAKWFAKRQEIAALKAAERAKRTATGRGIEVGQFMSSSWGYDQTQVNFYKVTKLIGKTMVEVVAVPQIDVGDKGGSSMSTKVIPAEEPNPGAKTYRVQVKAGRAQINGNYASTWDGKPEYTSWYA